VSCAFGGSGVSPPGHIAIVVYFDVAAGAEIAMLRVVEIEVLDASGAIVARVISPIELRVSLPGRDEHHNLRTEPFAGAVPAGEKVRLCAGADLTPVLGAYQAKLRYRASISAVPAGGEEAAPLVLEGPLDQPWSTAGPARPA
jgi:hypothetical protein